MSSYYSSNCTCQRTYIRLGMVEAENITLDLDHIHSGGGEIAPFSDSSIFSTSTPNISPNPPLAEFANDTSIGSISQAEPANDVDQQRLIPNPVSQPSPVCDLAMARAKCKVGRKRKCEVIDKELLAKARVIRNRAAEIKRRYIINLEQTNTRLCIENEKLGRKLNEVEEEKYNLIKRLEAITSQLSISRARAQAQINVAEVSNILFDGFGESAVLTKLEYGKCIHNSQQRRSSINPRGLHTVTSREIVAKYVQRSVALVVWVLMWLSGHESQPAISSTGHAPISDAAMESLISLPCSPTM
ncbi:hypothetical protein K493DRAFT_296960 [Basidiobolus meristosporus CBS 931.73]|uniref:BZIP domain-containing protein n=1 Tax=Basidiobolus meristosporus CBS 931.73 TaxID=1314790 RepID=A0A1Y1Z2K0_9FUNG|nr:hypothetical protein K493DRAFT_296960 [Basidiobolus meristosporus CBS 931.73]|eukprot:ORY04521.1 hypothetical protein K493DRAFT_296960 [Basidiobolus meristosporus CBS 931.73]